jgi:predicted transcriptional regulator
MKILTFFISVFIFLTLFPLFSPLVYGVEVGQEAPFFKVKSADNQELTLTMVKGKVVSLFYESREVTEKNKALKETLKKFFQEQPAAVEEQFARVPVVNCCQANWPITKVWQYKLHENSQKEGLTIYGDWDGKMFTDYGMKDKESNYFIIDKKGRIRYVVSGKIGDEEITRIKDLLNQLVTEQ